MSALSGTLFVVALERLGLVGLPNSGKSALFNALTGAQVVVAPHPFSTTETQVGSASVPDARLDQLSTMSSSKKTVYSTVEMVDIAALVAGASAGEGLGNRFLAQIREVDAICYVLRTFENPQIVGTTNPIEALAELELELVIADADSLQNQLDRRKRAAKSDKSLDKEIAYYERALKVLSEGTPLYRCRDDKELDFALLKGLFLLTAKPSVAIVNISEDQIGDESLAQQSKEIGKMLGSDSEAIMVCVQLESEASQLDPEARKEALEGLGLGEGVLPRVARETLSAVGRETFFTTGDKESRAWTYRKGAKAPECAGVIHSDLQRGFIRAEVIHWDELIEIGSWSKAKTVGKLRVEGKDYQVVDGDVLEIRFNV